MNVLALCSGIGGIELGLKLAEPGARTVCYVERETYPLAVTLARIRQDLLDDAPIWTDLKTFDGKPWRGVVDCIAGGYPCQPFSVAGRRKGEADPRHLWPDIRRIVSEVEPRSCFFENVEGHLQLGFEQVWRDLRDLGYEVEAGIFSAYEVGSTQLRKRLFILADRDPQRQRGEDHGEQPPAGADRGGLQLGDTDGEGLEGRLQSDQTLSAARGGVHPATGDRLSWPPGPAAYDAWEEILRITPSLEPAIRRVADGLPHRVDRLAALGNAVVPAVAATAWRQLRKGAVSGSR